jgi:hypothetical protein
MRHEAVSAFWIIIGRRHVRPSSRREAAVDLGQRLQIGKRDMLVDHVHRLADEAEFDHRAVILDEARIRGAAGGRKPAGGPVTASTAADSAPLSASSRVRKQGLGRSRQSISQAMSVAWPSGAAADRRPRASSRARISAFSVSARPVVVEAQVEGARAAPG